MRAFVAPMDPITQLQHAIANALDAAGQGQPDAAFWPLLTSEFHIECVIENWAKDAEVRDVPVLALKVPQNESLGSNDVPLVAKRMAVVMNVCAKLGVQVRPIGHHDERLGKVVEKGRIKDKRDRLHNWSPINLNLDPQGTLVLYLSFQWISTVGGGQKRLIETTNTASTKSVRAYCGETIAHVGELANKAGLTLPIVTAPHVLSLGGILAISGHGSRLLCGGLQLVTKPPVHHRRPAGAAQAHGLLCLRRRGVRRGHLWGGRQRAGGGG